MARKTHKKSLSDERPARTSDHDADVMPINPNPANPDAPQTVKSRTKERYDNEQVDSGSSEDKIRKDEEVSNRSKKTSKSSKSDVKYNQGDSSRVGVTPYKLAEGSHLTHPQLKTSKSDRAMPNTNPFQPIQK
jgi:hypothetical protein